MWEDSEAGGGKGHAAEVRAKARQFLETESPGGLPDSNLSHVSGGVGGPRSSIGSHEGGGGGGGNDSVGGGSVGSGPGNSASSFFAMVLGHVRGSSGGKSSPPERGTHL